MLVLQYLTFIPVYSVYVLLDPPFIFHTNENSTDKVIVK